MPRARARRSLRYNKSRSLRAAWPLETHAIEREKRERERSCLFRLVPILNLRLNNDLLFGLDYRVSRVFIGSIEHSTTVRKRRLNRAAKIFIQMEVSSVKKKNLALYSIEISCMEFWKYFFLRNYSKQSY